jgi:hypothetical protein
MAYGNWGAYVWRNGEFMPECCDTSMKVGDATITGHAVIDTGTLIFEIERNWDPVICERLPDNEIWRMYCDDLVRLVGINKLQHEVTPILHFIDSDREVVISDIGFRYSDVASFKYKNISIEIKSDESSIYMPLRELLITTATDVWLCIYGISFGNGYDKSYVSKCARKYISYNEKTKEYVYDPYINKRMHKAQLKENRRQAYSGFKWSVGMSVKTLKRRRFRHAFWILKTGVMGLLDNLKGARRWM